MYSSDNEIIKQILAGKRERFANLIDKYKDQAMTLAMRMLKNREDAEEAAQDAFIRSYNALDKFEQRSKFSTWLYRIVYNVCATRLRKKNPDLIFINDDNEGEIPDELFSTPSPIIEYEQSEVVALISTVLETLPEKYATMLSLFYFQELRYDEICEVTGLPLGTVKTQLFRARTLLLKQLAQVYEIENV